MLGLLLPSTPRCLPFLWDRQLKATTFPKGFFPFLQPLSYSAIRKDEACSEITASEPKHTLYASNSVQTSRVLQVNAIHTPKFPSQAPKRAQSNSELQQPNLGPLTMDAASPHAHTLQWVHVSTHPTPLCSWGLCCPSNP